MARCPVPGGFVFPAWWSAIHRGMGRTRETSESAYRVGGGVYQRRDTDICAGEDQARVSNPSAVPTLRDKAVSVRRGKEGCVIYTIFLEDTFDSAHWLPNVPAGHKCKRMHGHTYSVRIEVSGTLGKESGWVIDYADIKS